MDLGLRGRTALVCASSRGLGRACAEALAAEGVHVFINGLDAARLGKTAAEIAGAGGQATPIAADITTEAGRAALRAACPAPDILVNNLAGPAPKKMVDVEADEWVEGLNANMTTPILITRACLPAMIERRFGRIINITSAMVTTPRSHQALSSGPRAGLTAVMKGLALDVARHNVTINNLLPERFDTDRQLFMAQRAMKMEGISMEAARNAQIASIPAARLGRPSEFGATCAFLCSDHAGFITGMNMHLDGGAYPALL